MAQFVISCSCLTMTVATKYFKNWLCLSRPTTWEITVVKVKAINTNWNESAKYIKNLSSLCLQYWVQASFENEHIKIPFKRTILYLVYYIEMPILYINWLHNLMLNIVTIPFNSNVGSVLNWYTQFSYHIWMWIYFMKAAILFQYMFDKDVINFSGDEVGKVTAWFHFRYDGYWHWIRCQ